TSGMRLVLGGQGPVVLTTPSALAPALFLGGLLAHLLFLVPTPRAETPPAETPPTETPPEATPPAETPPAATSPAETPPAPGTSASRQHQHQLQRHHASTRHQHQPPAPGTSTSTSRQHQHQLQRRAASTRHQRQPPAPGTTGTPPEVVSGAVLLSVTATAPALTPTCRVLHLSLLHPPWLRSLWLYLPSLQLLPVAGTPPEVVSGAVLLLVAATAPALTPTSRVLHLSSLP
ncbi:unnamed protein product, partial [Closterium sp. NIES-53]